MSKLMYTDDEGNDVAVPDGLLKQIEDLKAQIAWLELKEKLHLRLIAGGNDELARRGKKIEELQGIEEDE